MRRLTGDSRPALAAGIRAFLAWKTLGVLWSLAYVVWAIRWALPRFSQGGAEMQSAKSTYVTEIAIDASEAGLTALGLVLIVQRHRIARRYCIALLCLYCLARLSDVLLGLEPLTPALFLVTGMAWLVYWLFAQGPRELALSRFWTQSRRNL